MRGQIKVVYITSRGHSGSTLLDLLLSSHDEVVSVGEAKCLVTRPQEPCTCGAASVWACPFWHRVDAAIQERAGLRLREIEIDSGDPEIFARHNAAFFEAVSAVSGKDVIVDSSKNVDRLAALLEAGIVELLPIHLIRSPFGVVYSNVRLGRDWLHHAYNYTHAAMRTRRVLEGLDHLEIRYGPLVSNTEKTMQEVMRRVGLSFQRKQLDWAGRSRHNIYGNPLRFSTNSAMRPDDAWKKGLALQQKAAIAWLTLPCRFRVAVYERWWPLFKRKGLTKWSRQVRGRWAKRVGRLFRG